MVKRACLSFSESCYRLRCNRIDMRKRLNIMSISASVTALQRLRNWPPGEREEARERVRKREKKESRIYLVIKVYISIFCNYCNYSFSDSIFNNLRVTPNV